MRYISLAAASIAVLLPLHATAQSTQAENWSGFYAGAFTSVNTNAHSTHNNLTTGNTTGEFEISGRTTGLALGYNWQSDSLVYGAELDAGWGSIEGSTDVICSLGGCVTDIKAIYTARGRLGYAYGAFMPYMTAGVAMATVDIDVNDGAGEARENVFGYALGLGSEYAVSERFTLKADLLFMDFNAFETEVDAGGGNTVTDEIETDATQLRIGANFRF